jgi:hypothetical protein
MARRRRNRNANARLAQPPSVPSEPRVVVREARHVERLVYSRSQAAEALGVSRSTSTGSSTLGPSEPASVRSASWRS